MPDPSDTLAASDAATPVTLWREIDALGGEPSRSSENEYAHDTGFNAALEQVREILERRGYSEHADSVGATPDQSLLYVIYELLPPPHGNWEDTHDGATVARNIAKLFEPIRAELEGMRQNRDNLRVYLAERTEQRDQAQHDRTVMNTQVDMARRILRAVTDAAIRPPAALDPTIRIAPGKRTGQQAAEVALWQHQCTANAVRFVAELATMTDNECDFLDGHEMRGIARLLQVPDDEGNRAPTVPRLYTDEDRDRAANVLGNMAIGYSRSHDLARVDAIAEALGMRRAGA